MAIAEGKFLAVNVVAYHVLEAIYALNERSGNETNTNPASKELQLLRPHHGDIF